MSADTPIENPHQRVPSVDALACGGHQQLTVALREELTEIHAQISCGEEPEQACIEQLGRLHN